METKVEKEVRFLKIYTVFITVVLAVFMLTSFINKDQNQKFEEIDVERINIVEKDGKLKMVISNQERQHPGISNGKIIERDGPRAPGILFFNHLGDEMGGLAFGDNGENGHWGSLTFDKVRGDQTIGFRHIEGEEGNYSAAVEIWQQPKVPGEVWLAKRDSVLNLKDEAARKAAYQKMRNDEELMLRRLYLGKTRDNATLLEMLDSKGNTRIVMMVTEDGTPKLEFWDINGEVVYSIPETTSAKEVEN